MKTASYLDLMLVLVLVALASARQVSRQPFSSPRPSTKSLVEIWGDDGSLEITYLNSRGRRAGVYLVDFRHSPALLDLTLNGSPSFACEFNAQGCLRLRGGASHHFGSR